MVGSVSKGLVGVIAAASLFVSSTAAVAAAARPRPAGRSVGRTRRDERLGAGRGAVRIVRRRCRRRSAAAQAAPGCVLPVIDTPVAAAPPLQRAAARRSRSRRSRRLVAASASVRCCSRWPRSPPALAFTCWFASMRTARPERDGTRLGLI